MEELEDVKKDLEAKRQELALELESAKGKVAGIASDLRRVDDALRALTKKKGRIRSRSKPSTSAVAGGGTRSTGMLSGSTFFSDETEPLH